MCRTIQLSDLYAVTGCFARTGCVICTSQTLRPMLSRMTPLPRPLQQQTRPSRTVDAARIETALMKVSRLVVEDAAFTPIFERLEAELSAAVKEETRLTDAQRRAGALLSQNAIPRTNSATCSKDAPLPYRSRSSR